jgi:hypothetical protein
MPDPMTASQARFASLTIWHGNAWLKKSFSQLQKLCPIIIEGGVVARRLGCAARRRSTDHTVERGG